MTSLYALGWTQHTVGSQNIRAIACIQLLLGNMGMPGGGVNALRGHSNIQGLTDLGVMSHLLPGYLTLPTEKEPDLKTYLEKKTPKPLRPGQMNYWQNYPKFFVSLLKAWFGAAATKENDFRFDWLPKNDKTYDILAAFELMFQGKINGYFCQGFNPLASVPDKGKLTDGPLQAQVPGGHRPAHHRDLHLLEEPPASSTTSTAAPSRPRSSASPPPASPRRTARWSAAAAAAVALEGGRSAGRGQGRPRDHGRDLPGAAGPLPEGGRHLPGPHPQAAVALPVTRGRPRPTSWPASSTAGRWPTSRTPRTRPRRLAKEGEQLATFAHLQADGTTACGCWIFCGSWTQNGNQMARRDAADPTGLGNTPGWAWSWPANRRILYNRASADPAGKPWDASPQVRLLDRQEVGGRRRPRHQARRARPRRACPPSS